MSETETISSKDNSRLKAARAVRDGREPGKLLVEGVRLFREALRSDLSLEDVFISTDVFETPQIRELRELVLTSRSAISTVAAKAFDSITDTENSQGIVGIARRPEFLLEGIRANTQSGLIVFLNKINNPSNLGAIVRTAEAAGVSATITSKDSADAYSPKAVRASMGSAFRLPIIQGIEFESVLEWARERKVRTVAADVNSNIDYTDLKWEGSTLLILGSEAHGLNPGEIRLIDETVFIPMENDVESLNLAVSVGIILFEAKRQRDARVK